MDLNFFSKNDFCPPATWNDGPKKPSVCYTLSPSSLTFLWDECKRCFWLQMREGIYRPRIPMPSVFNKHHDVLQRYFDKQPTSLTESALPPGRFHAYEYGVRSSRIELSGVDDCCKIKGRIDHLIAFEDGTFGVVDYKTSVIRETHVAKYARQLHAYAWALERPAGGAELGCTISRLGLLCLEPNALCSCSAEHGATMHLNVEWIDIPRDDAGFREFLREVVRLLGRDEAPEPAPDCSYCAYHRTLTERKQPEKQSSKTRLPF